MSFIRKMPREVFGNVTSSLTHTHSFRRKRAKGPLDLTTRNIWVNLGGATRHFATRLARHTPTSPVRIAPSIGQRRIGIDPIVAR